IGVPSALERLMIDRSVPVGAVIVPPAAIRPVFVYRRKSWPPAQRMPAPNVTPAPPGPAGASPCRKMQLEPESMRVPVKVSVPGSVAPPATLAVPDELMLAPELPVLAQPSPAPFALPHAQGIVPPVFGTH